MMFPSSKIPLLRLAPLLLSAAAPATLHASVIDWALFAPDCPRDTSTLEVACGSHGVYHLVNVVAPAGCTPLATGSEDPPVYSGGPHAAPFPYPPTPIEETTVSRSLDSKDGTGQRAATGSPGGGAVGSGGGTTAPARWLAVVDYDTPHGWTTTYVADLLSGSTIEAYLVQLDDPDLDLLGSDVNDFHVLAALCKILDYTDGDAPAPPLGVNMSFGRFLAASEAGLGPACNDGTAACEIAHVVDELRGRGATVAAAAGNYGELLFPAGLAQALPVGMMDVDAMFAAPTSAAPAVWETPAEAGAIVPGGHLCVEGWPLPSGSSYSSAILSGWLAKLSIPYDLDPHAAAAWYPIWQPDLGCWVLHDGASPYPRCNAAFSTLMDGLAGGSEMGCWAAAPQPVVVATNPSAPTTQPGVPSFDAWAAGTHPTPEGDPCVPCVGLVETSWKGTDLEVDMSQSEPLAPGVYVDEVLLRVGASFFPLMLDASELALIEDGELAVLRLEGWSWTSPYVSQPSLYFVMKPSPSIDCDTSPDCYFQSTPIYVKQASF